MRDFSFEATTGTEEGPPRGLSIRATLHENRFWINVRTQWTSVSLTLRRWGFRFMFINFKTDRRIRRSWRMSHPW